MSERITSFTKLEAWQHSRKLALAIYSNFERLHRYDSLRSQVERAAVSVTSNIAEGFGRQTIADKRHFYVMARGSLYELQNQLLVARDTKKISPNVFNQLAELTIKSLMILHGLIRSLNKK